MLAIYVIAMWQYGTYMAIICDIIAPFFIWNRCGGNSALTVSLLSVRKKILNPFRNEAKMNVQIVFISVVYTFNNYKFNF